MLSLVEHEKCFITSGPGIELRDEGGGAGGGRGRA